MNSNKNNIQKGIVDNTAKDLVNSITSFNPGQYLLQTKLLIQEIKGLQNRWQAQRSLLRYMLKDKYTDWSNFGRYHMLRDDLLEAAEIKQVLLKANNFIDYVRQMFFGPTGQIYFLYGVEAGRGSNKHIEEYRMTIAEAIELSSVTLDSKTREIKLRLKPSLEKLRGKATKGEISSVTGDYKQYSAISNYVYNVLNEHKSAGYIYETYRSYLAQGKTVDLQTKQGIATFTKIYKDSKNNISGLLGGDVDSDQVKAAGGTFSLTTTLINELNELVKIFNLMQTKPTVTTAKKVITETLLKNKKDLVTSVEKESREKSIEYLNKFLKINS